MHQIPRIAAMAGALLLVVSGTVSAQAAAEPTASPSATEPELVVEGGYYAVAMALDPDGHRHVVTSEIYLTNEMLRAGQEMTGDLWYATDRDGSWAIQRLLAGDGPDLGWNDASIAVDDDGSVHIAVVSDHLGSTPGETEGIFYLTDKGRAPGDFGPMTMVAGANMTSPSLAVVDGAHYLVYGKTGQPGDPPPPRPVFFATDRSGPWVKQRLADFGSMPVIRVDPAGHGHIVYIGDDANSLDSSLYYVEVDAETGAPTEPRRIPATTGLPYSPALALDPSGRPHVAWHTVRDIAWTMRAAEGSSHPEMLGTRRQDSLSLSVDQVGQPHVVFAGRGATDRGIIHAQRGAGTWVQSVIAEGVDRTSVASAVLGDDLVVAWAPGRRPVGLWSYGPVAVSDPAAIEAHEALVDLQDSVAVDGCVPFLEQGENDPFSFGAQAAVACDEPVRDVRQLALFRFPDAGSMAGYWDWRVSRIEPAPPIRDDACAGGRRGISRWEHGDVVCYVSPSSGEAKLRWTDERTSTYGVLDARDREIAGLHQKWLALRAAPLTE